MKHPDIFLICQGFISDSNLNNRNELEFYIKSQTLQFLTNFSIGKMLTRLRLFRYDKQNNNPTGWSVFCSIYPPQIPISSLAF